MNESLHNVLKLVDDNYVGRCDPTSLRLVVSVVNPAQVRAQWDAVLCTDGSGMLAKWPMNSASSTTP